MLQCSARHRSVGKLIQWKVVTNERVFILGLKELRVGAHLQFVPDHSSFSTFASSLRALEGSPCSSRSYFGREPFAAL